jgi:hypothetical protein
MSARRRQRRQNPDAGPWIGWALAAGLVGLGAYALTKTEWARLQSLEPETRRRVETLLTLLRNRGIEVSVGSTRRTEAEQQKVIDAEKSAATISWHLSGRAVDIYPLIPGTREPDYKPSRPDLYRIMHQEWARLGGTGIAYKPYPDGPNRIITTSKGTKLWDGGHIEYHGPYATASAAYLAGRAA